MHINYVQYDPIPAFHGTASISLTDKDGRLMARSKIEAYEAALKDAMGSDRGDMDTINEKGLKEHFIGGAYIRELLIPKGTTIVGQIWRKDRFWIIASGDITFMTETGTKRVQGPYTEVPPMGSKTALYAHEETLWFAVTGAQAKNNDEAESELIAKDYSECAYPWTALDNGGDACHGES